MSGVGSWDPEASTIDDELLSQLMAVREQLEENDLGLEPEVVKRLASCIRSGAEAWHDAAAAHDDEELVTLIQVLTVAEAKLPGCEAGAQSPVIALAAELRRRHAYPDDLTAWIKARTANRFLPHGSLMDKL
jgi:hypothetical protein